MRALLLARHAGLPSSNALRCVSLSTRPGRGSRDGRLKVMHYTGDSFVFPNKDSIPSLRLEIYGGILSRDYVPRRHPVSRRLFAHVSLWAEAVSTCSWAERAKESGSGCE